MGAPMLTICTWLWGNKYGDHYVRRLFAGLERHINEPVRLILVTDRFCDLVDVEQAPIPDPRLTVIKGCFARLRMFDPAWQSELEIVPGTRLVCIDLDSIITRNLDPLFARPETFMILTGANAKNPCPYNGSVFMLRAGTRPDVWSDFSIKAAARVPHYQFPDDQAWLAFKIPATIGWRVGAPSGIYAFQKPGWPPGDDLPADARLVVFPGARDPAQFQHLAWVKERWAA